MPIYTARFAHVRVPVVRNGNGFCVVWRSVDGRRQRRSFSKKQEAVNFADATARSILAGHTASVRLSDSEVAEYTAARELLAPSRIPLLSAVKEYLFARERLGTITLDEAVRIATLSSGLCQCPQSPELLASFIATLRRRDCSARHVLSLESDLAPFCRDFPNLRAVSASDIEKWLFAQVTRRSRNVRGEVRPVGSKLSTRRRNNVRDAIAALFRFAQGSKYLPPGDTAADAVPKVKGVHEIEIFTPEQVAAMLDWCADHARELIPLVTLGAFAGMRTSEIRRLQWSMLKWRSGVIAIPASVARKVKSPRKTPILPVLAAWLEPWSSLTAGAVLEQTNSEISRTLRRMCRALGWSHWVNNGLRHSYASHRLVIRQDKAAVALEMGTSPAMLDANYNNPPDPEVATAYFSILPTAPSNIASFKRA